MKTLVVAATQQEIQPLSDFLRRNKKGELLITGVGMLNTAYYLTRALLKNKYDIVINAGIAGAFNNDIAIGEVVQVTTERTGDMGAEDHDRFLDVFDLGLTDTDAFPLKNGVLVNPENKDISEAFRGLRKVSAITVSKTHGSAQSIENAISKYAADIESMEGAAVFFCCLMESVTFTEIRAISNYVEPRNKDNWNIGLAVKRLNEVLIDIFNV